MLYELRTHCFFSDEASFLDVVDKLNDAKGDMVVVNPGQPNQQCSVIDQMHCYHDESPHGPCNLIDHWDNCPVL